MTNNLLKCTLIILLLISLVHYSQGQPGPVGPPPPNPVPLSGIEILLGAGALLGIRKIWIDKKRKPTSQ